MSYAGRTARAAIGFVVAAMLATTAVARAQSPDSTATLHYKGLTLQPVGFVAAEMLYRSANEEADIGSTFNGIPFTGSTPNNLPEFRGSGRQSRIGLLATGATGQTKITGFWESDFLTVGTTSNSTESNSYAMRVRQFWGQASFASGWSVAGGQMWSLVTTDKSGIAPRAEWVPLTIDAQYAVGFDWARQFALRATDKLSKTAAFAVALEGAQTTLAVRGAPSNYVLGAVGGSLLNGTANYSSDPAPDVVAKLAFDPGWGHFEIKAVGVMMRDRIWDPSDTIGGTRNASTTGGGIGVGILLPIVAKKLDVGFSGLTGSGIGRYGTSGLPDATLNSDLTLAPLSEWSAMITVEAHPTPSLDLFAYAGEEYVDNQSQTLDGKPIGYGLNLDDSGCMKEAAPTGTYAPGSGSPCNADTKDIQQFTVGFWHRFYKGAAGTLQWGVQYSHTTREAWPGLNAVQAKGSEDMGFMSFRFVLP